MPVVSVAGVNSLPCFFCQLGHAKSLREICGGLAASEGKLRHLGLPTAPARSTLAYANEHRPWQLQQTIFEQLLAKCQSLAASQPGTRKLSTHLRGDQRRQKA